MDDSLNINQSGQQPGFWDGLLNVAKTPFGQGLLSAGFTALSGAGHLRPINLLGAAGQSGLLGYNQAEENQNTMGLKNVQLQTAQQALERQKQILQLQKRFATPAAGNAMGTVAAQGNAPGTFDGQGGYIPPVNNIGPTQAAAAVLPSQKATFDYGGYADALAPIDPTAALAIKSSLQKETPFNKLDPKDFTPASVAAFAKSGNYGDLRQRDKMEMAPSGQVWNPYGATNGQVFNDPNKPMSFDPVTGNFVPNLGYQSYELSKAKAGRPLTSVQVNNKMGEGVAAQVGPIMKESYDAALGAQQQIANADRLIAAINTGKAFTGPGASFKLGAAQLGQMMGIGGRDTADQILNTRAAIQGLAQSTLAARSSLKGQGQVSDYEGKLIERAASGDIDNLTGPEIKQLAMINKRLSQQIVAQHKVRVNKLLGHDSTAGIADMYDLSDMPTAPDNTIDFGSLK